MFSNLRQRATVALVTAGIVLALAGTANAGPLVADAPNCESQTLSQTFLPWADVALYTLQPGGSFENGASQWTLSGAKVGNGNEPANVTSASDSKSLTISDGGSATSGSICVGIEHPDIRFFAKSSNPLAQLKVEVLFEDATGTVQSAPIGALSASKGWVLTPPYVMAANLLALLPDSRTAVAFRFSATGGDFTIDDVYVDPIQRW